MMKTTAVLLLAVLLAVLAAAAESPRIIWEWNAKDGNLDRDLSAYRAWHEAGVISAAVLITQDRLKLKALAHRIWGNHLASLPEADRDQKLPIDLGTSTTTNLEKAELRVRRGVMGTCPLLVVAATEATWNGKPFTAT